MKVRRREYQRARANRRRHAKRWPLDRVLKFVYGGAVALGIAPGSDLRRTWDTPDLGAVPGELPEQFGPGPRPVYVEHAYYLTARGTVTLDAATIERCTPRRLPSWLQWPEWRK